MMFGICLQALIPQRQEPKESSEMINQLLFGDHYTVIEAEEKWLKIKTENDAYEGYIDTKCHTALSPSEFNEWKNAEKACVNSIQSLLINNNPNLLSPGCHLPVDDLSWLKHNYKKVPTSWASVAKLFINTPYLWGGKNPYGIDCSGFTQCVANAQNIPLLRDAYQQAKQGEACEQKNGALAFFTNKKGRVTHVGIVINDTQIIHASGKVRIDSLSSEGIIHSDTKQITHTLSHFRCIGL
jgi:hypothetical protein